MILGMPRFKGEPLVLGRIWGLWNHPQTWNHHKTIIIYSTHTIFLRRGSQICKTPMRDYEASVQKKHLLDVTLELTIHDSRGSPINPTQLLQ